MLFITGSESYIGKRLIEICKINRIKYFGVDINTKNTKNSKKIDIRDKNLKKYIPNNSTIIHLAAISKDKDCNRNPNLCMDVNINGTLNLIHAAKKKSIRNFIFASSEWVYGDNRSNLLNENSKIIIDENFSLYAQSKIVIEKFLNTSKIFKNINILRFGIIYGGIKKKNWSAVESIFEIVKKENKILIGSKKTSRKFIYLDDLINGILLSIKSKGYNVFNLSGNKSITLKKIVKISEKCLHKKIKIYEKNPNKPSIRNIDGSKAIKNLGWKISMRLEDYLKIRVKKNGK
tara:strand:+ start:475 stop:1344 length:870 start_codon:yes stop_codon:yes gene_type:complete